MSVLPPESYFTSLGFCCRLLAATQAETGDLAARLDPALPPRPRLAGTWLSSFPSCEGAADSEAKLSLRFSPSNTSDLRDSLHERRLYRLDILIYIK